MNSPLRVIEVLLEAGHPREESHDVGAQQWYTEQGRCRFCTCAPGRHQSEHPRMRLAVNPSLVKAIQSVSLFGTPMPGYVYVFTTMIDDHHPLLVAGTVESVLAELNAE